jgi:hypothetical protein
MLGKKDLSQLSSILTYAKTAFVLTASAGAGHAMKATSIVPAASVSSHWISIEIFLFW